MKEKMKEKMKEGLNGQNLKNSFAHRQMIKYQNKTHFRIEQEYKVHKEGDEHEAQKYKRLPLCKSTGWLCCTKTNYGCCRCCSSD